MCFDFDLESASKLKLETGTKSSFPSGRLRVIHDGEWGTICHDGWNMKNTHIACRQLGYTKGLAYTPMGRSKGRVWLDNVVCLGIEGSIDQCSHNGWGTHDCTHGQDVGIVCYDGKGKRS